MGKLRIATDHGSRLSLDPLHRHRYDEETLPSSNLTFSTKEHNMIDVLYLKGAMYYIPGNYLISDLRLMRLFIKYLILRNEQHHKRPNRNLDSRQSVSPKSCHPPYSTPYTKRELLLAFASFTTCSYYADAKQPP